MRDYRPYIGWWVSTFHVISIGKILVHAILVGLYVVDPALKVGIALQVSRGNVNGGGNSFIDGFGGSDFVSPVFTCADLL